MCLCIKSTCCTSGQRSHDAVGFMTQLFMKPGDVILPRQGRLDIELFRCRSEDWTGPSEPGTAEWGWGSGCRAAPASAAETRRVAITGLSGRKRRTSRAHKCTSAGKGSSASIQDGQLWRGLWLSLGHSSLFSLRPSCWLMINTLRLYSSSSLLATGDIQRFGRLRVCRAFFMCVDEKSEASLDFIDQTLKTLCDFQAKLARWNGDTHHALLHIKWLKNWSRKSHDWGTVKVRMNSLYYHVAGE